jgi:phosphoglycerol geranylgeranyltransferase
LRENFLHRRIFLFRKNSYSCAGADPALARPDFSIFDSKSDILKVLQHLSQSPAGLAILVDPDKAAPAHLERLVQYALDGHVGHFLVGGSLLFSDALVATVDHLRVHTEVPVTLFPGNPAQVYSGAHAVLLLSLISGRNADLLIGRHVESAPALRRSGLEIIPTGYLLIDGGIGTAVSYISNTTPIPAHKPELAAATAMAGEMLGLQCLYLEAGSGARQPVPTEMIQAVRSSVRIPLIVGGGLRDPDTAFEKSKAGADVIVVGTAVEQHPQLIPEMAMAIREGNALKVR